MGSNVQVACEVVVELKLMGQWRKARLQNAMQIRRLDRGARQARPLANHQVLLVPYYYYLVKHKF